MRFKLLLILTSILFISTVEAQKTYIPDDNFENRLIALGYDDVLDDSVSTASIDTVLILDVESKYIADLTGIAGFTALRELHCGANDLTNLDLSNNSALTKLICPANDLTSLDLSQNAALNYLDCRFQKIVGLDMSGNPNLEHLACNSNQLTTLNVSNNLLLKTIWCGGNKLTGVDFSNNALLEEIECSMNYFLTSLNLANGNNTNINSIDAYYSHDLFCIEVDDATFSSNTWTLNNGFQFEAQVVFSENCTPLNVITNSITAFNLYPNPTTHLINIELEEKASYNLYSTLGKTVLKSGNLKEGHSKIDLSGFDTGMYMLKVTNEQGLITTRKIIKQ